MEESGFNTPTKEKERVYLVVIEKSSLAQNRCFN